MALQDAGDLADRPEAGVVRRVHELLPVQLGGPRNVAGPAAVAQPAVVAGVLVVGARVEEDERCVVQSRVDPVRRHAEVDGFVRGHVAGCDGRRLAALDGPARLPPRADTPVEHERPVAQAEEIEGHPCAGGRGHAGAVEDHPRRAADPRLPQRGDGLLHRAELGAPPRLPVPGDRVEAQRARPRDVLPRVLPAPALDLHHHHALVADVAQQPVGLDERLDRLALQTRVPEAGERISGRARGLLGQPDRRREDGGDDRGAGWKPAPNPRRPRQVHGGLRTARSR